MITNSEAGLSEPSRRSSRFAFVVLVVLQVCFSALLAFLVLLFQFAFDACGEGTCDYGLGDVSMWTGWIGIMAALAVTIVLGQVLHRRGHGTWWLPVAGSGVALASTVLSYYLTLRATGLTHM